MTDKCVCEICSKSKCEHDLDGDSDIIYDAIPKLYKDAVMRSDGNLTLDVDPYEKNLKNMGDSWLYYGDSWNVTPEGKAYYTLATANCSFEEADLTFDDYQTISWDNEYIVIEEGGGFDGKILSKYMKNKYLKGRITSDHEEVDLNKEWKLVEIYDILDEQDGSDIYSSADEVFEEWKQHLIELEESK